VKDYEKTISFQKAKIVALQSELEDTVKAAGNNDAKFDELEKLNQKLNEENKKLNDKLNQNTVAYSKMKTQNNDLQARIIALEKTVADQNKELEAVERDKRKAF
jgi:chromosome segregation ATPase